jgi:hypothetical protein
VERIRYFHWNEEEANQNVKKISALGFETIYDSFDSQKDFRKIRENIPDVYIIDLSRLPSHGREIGTALRSFKSTRRVPIVFLEGTKEKVERVKKVLPDAFYTDWRNLKSTIQKAVKSDLQKVLVKKNVLEAYSGTPLVQKLGIKQGLKIGVLNAPRNLKSILGELPSAVTIITKPKISCDLILWFVKVMIELDSGIENRISLINEKGAIWILWPKRNGKLKSDLTQQDIRNAGLSRGMVDFKICSFDETWSGLKFTRRYKRK